MTVNEAMEEFRKIATGHPVLLCDCATCDGWLPKVRNLFQAVYTDAFRLGQLDACLDVMKIILNSTIGGRK